MLNSKDSYTLLQMLQQTECEAIRRLCADEALYQHIVQSLPVYKPSNFRKISWAVLEAVGAIGTSIDVWWTLTYAAVYVAPAVFLALSLTVALLAALGGILFCIYTYHQRKQQIETIQTTNYLFDLKLIIANAMIAKFGQDTMRLEPTPIPTASTWDTCVLGTGYTAVILVSYFGGTIGILETLNFVCVTALMTSPVGITLGVALAISLGLYASYVYHKTHPNKYALKAYHTEKSHLLREKIGMCHVLQAAADEKQGIAPRDGVGFRFFSEGSVLPEAIHYSQPSLTGA